MTAIWLLLTIVLELPFHLYFLRRHTWYLVALACVFVNGFTHPIASAAVLQWDFPWVWVELTVTLVETVLIALTWRTNWLNAFAMSLVANGVTAGTGWLIGNLF